MRRTIFLLLGALEFAAAGLLVVLGAELPSRSDVNQTFEHAGRVTDRAGIQVRLLHRQVGDLRRPELQQLAARLQQETKAVTKTLKSRSVDYESVKTLRDALGDVATGLDGLAETLDPERIGRLGKGLGETADFLDKKVVPTAQTAADSLDGVTDALRHDAKDLSALLREAPPDLQAARDAHESLGRFDEGLGKMRGTLKPERIGTLREGFSGLEDALTGGAGEVERLANYTYPSVRFDGLRAVIDNKPFWPEGGRIAGGMRKAADGAKAAGEEINNLVRELPKLDASIAESQTIVRKTRDALGATLKQRDKLEPLLKEMPNHVARLADELPKLGEDLGRMLRDTKKLNDVADSLRQAEQGIALAVERWPQLRRTLGRSATLLKTMRGELDNTLKHREDYEAALRQTVVLADSFATLLPLLSEQFGEQMHDQERALDDLGQSIDEVSTALPAYAGATNRLVDTARWLVWLIAGIAGLHGAYLMLGQGLGVRYSP